MSNSTSQPGPGSHGPSGPKIWNCVNCRRRKLRCSRSEPCVQCTKSGIECHFPVTGRLPRRTRETGATGPTEGSAAAKQTDLLSRLRRLEAVVTELAGQIEEGPGPSATGSTPGTDRSGTGTMPSGGGDAAARDEHSLVAAKIGAELDEEFGTLVAERDGFIRVGKGFWSVFCDEVDHIFEAVQDVADIRYGASEGSSEDWVDYEGSMRGHHQSFVLGQTIGARDSRLLHPLPSQMLYIWQTFERNVDPFIKILHGSTMRSLIAGLGGSLSTLPAEEEVLLMAVSLAAVVSLDDTDVNVNFSVPKAQLLARYRLGTEQALAKAEFLSTSSIRVVQALTIYVSVLPQLAAQRLAWPLVGVLLRVATSNGLHRDPAGSGQNLQLTAREVEERRRLWWHICFVDSRARCSVAPGLTFPMVSFDTKMPRNCSDADLESAAGDGACAVTESFTSSMLAVMRCELWAMSRTLQQQKALGINWQMQTLQANKTRLQARLAALVDEKNPACLFLLALTCLFFAKAELALSPGQWGSAQSRNDQQRQEILRLSVEIVHKSHALRMRSEWKQWRWQLAGQPPLRSILLGLTELLHDPWMPGSETALSVFRDELQSLVDEASTDPQHRRLMELLSRVELRRSQVNSSASAMRRPELYQPPGEDGGAGPRHVDDLSVNLNDLYASESSQLPMVEGLELSAGGIGGGEELDFGLDLLPLEDMMTMDWESLEVSDIWALES